MIVFGTEKEFSHFAVGAPRVAPSFSPRIALSASRFSERSLVVVGFVFSSPLNFARRVLASSNFASTLVRSTKSKRRLDNL